MIDKNKKMGKLLLKNITDIIRKDLEEDMCMLSSVNEVKMNRDNTFAHIYVTHLIKEKSKDLVDYLNSEKGYIRQRLGKMMDVYKVPDLLFVEDDLYDKGAEIDNILRKINEKK